MRYGVFVVMLCLAMLCYLGTSTASSDAAVDCDPLRPSSVLSIMGRGVHALFAHVRDIGQALTDAAGNPQRASA